ncbi:MULTISPECIES: DCC1-like thiol-disulfide oxidoreductase family protein [unclassified Novosphingobium]|uniref:DCC1-like thiol-disulfide oxidoreductase family protein n=1 Tax=unclassified Novosphingobium TaxID=2644732 RepID=UPI0025CD805E|nr:MULTISPECIES: DCC1-like thiol-disulfide oxidoreductase family protein [unclassified Novosphingobium]MDR6707489.1 putative DCC family thiol-disulfide oxidoreductase YuxK [Novosphingobium sp. 1748]
MPRPPQQTHAPSRRNRLTVWYDGGCPLCLREIALMRRWDRAGNIAFIDLGVQAQACPLDRQLMLARFHAQEDGVMLDGAAAFAAMWRAIPRLRLLGELARYRLVLWGLEAAYAGFLKIRPVLQRWLR